MSGLAKAYTTCDNHFCSFLGPTYPNRFFMHAGQTDRVTNTSTTSTLPTIWDQLNLPGGPTGRYYFNDLPVLALWGAKYLPIAAHWAQFLVDATAGTLPNVSYIDPRFEDTAHGISNDDHPLSDIRAGDAFLSEIYTVLSKGPRWANTVLVVVYDEWGGFYDHVAPPRVTPGVDLGSTPSSGVDQDIVDGRALLGFRVPCIVASPFARASVAHGLYDHTSVLKMIEWRWGLQPLSARDASTLPDDPGNLVEVLDLGYTAPTARLPFLLPPPTLPCGTPGAVAAQVDNTWSGLQKSGLLDPWKLTGM
jgi:phospholipase C